MWSNQLKKPVLRLGISLIIVIAAYGAFALAWNYKRHKLTPTQQLASFRSTLDQTYLAGDQLANFKQTDAVASDVLLQRFTTFQDSVKLLTSRLDAIREPILSIEQRNTAIAYRDAQNYTIDRFKVNYTVVKDPLSYDPTYDLTSNNPVNDTAKLQKRSRAAQAGLGASLAPITSSSSSLVAQPSQTQPTTISSASRKLIQNSADCFGTLANQLGVKQYGPAATTRSICVADYPALREQLLNDLLSTSFSDARETSSQLMAKRLLQQIDDQLKKN